ncbi:MAG: YicC/YloC family endoribonuclease [Granulosicoccus sp.]
MNEETAVLSSMTAFGCSEATDERGYLRCEVRSVNSRHLDISVRMADGLSHMVGAIRDRTTAKISRGKVDVVFTFRPSEAGHSRLQIDNELLDELLRVCRQATQRADTATSIDIVRLVQWPGVISQAVVMDNGSADQIMHLFDEALDDHLQARRREGDQLRLALESRATQMQQVVWKLHRHRSGAVDSARERLLGRLKKLDIEHDADRLEQELVYTAQRMDIDEELDRLDAHLKEFHAVIERDEPVGRRLDFLMQEFNREANTVASKSSDSETTAHSVDLKVLIDQMREQIQNIE